MFRPIAGALALLVLTLALGCAKKAAKNTNTADFAPDSTPAPSADTKGSAAKKNDSPEKESWLRPRPKDGELPASGTGAGQPWVKTPPTAGNGQVPPPPTGTGVGPQGQPAVPQTGQPQPPTPQPPASGTTTGTSGKVVTKADMNEVWVFAENFSQANQGKMPPPEVIYAALVKEKATAAELVKSNDILLTGTTHRESVWAYERKAPTQGGWIATQNGPEEVTATEFARRIKQ